MPAATCVCSILGKARSRAAAWRRWQRAGHADKPKDAIDEAKYLFLPVSEYLTIPGVTAAIARCAQLG